MGASTRTRAYTLYIQYWMVALTTGCLNIDKCTSDYHWYLMDVVHQ